MKKEHIFKFGKYEIIARHYCHTSVYYVEGDISQQKIIDCIPENISEISDITEIREIHKNIMAAMNFLWSSTGTEPCFPEKYSEYTKYSRGTEGMVFIGRGWEVIIYFNGYDTYINRNNTGAERYMKEVNSIPHDENHIKNVNKLLEECVMNLLGKQITLQ